MEAGVGFGPGVLLGDLGAELDVIADGLAEGLVVGHRGLVEGLQVSRDEAVALTANGAVPNAWFERGPKVMVCPAGRLLVPVKVTLCP